MIWGGIQSPLLEERTEEQALQSYMEHLLAKVGRKPIILSVVDMVMGHNSVARIRYIAELLERHVITVSNNADGETRVIPTHGAGN